MMARGETYNCILLICQDFDFNGGADKCKFWDGVMGECMEFEEDEKGGGAKGILGSSKERQSFHS